MSAYCSSRAALLDTNRERASLCYDMFRGHEAIPRFLLADAKFRKTRFVASI